MLYLKFWDVQHGNAAYIKTPNGQHIAVDLGVGSYKGSDKTFSPLLRLKNYWEVNQLDAVIITHPHRDHLDDIGNFDKLSPKVLVRPNHLTDADIRAGNRKDDESVISKYIEVSNAYSGGVASGTSPLDPAVNGCSTFTWFTPKKCPRTNLNNHSLALVVGYAGSKILIPGDNEPASWDELLADPQFRTAIKGTDILLAPHHGRESGFCPKLFDHINPYLTIISDGRYCDTSATDRYCAKTRGWKVWKRNGGSEERKCVTTRNDGVVEVECYVTKEGNNCMKVTID